MKIFLDANILVATLNKEYPIFTYTSRILSLTDRPGFRLYTSSLCLAVAFYFASKKSGVELARNKIIIVKEKINLAIISEDAVNRALSNPKVIDIEDGFQYYAAKEAGCECIITEDLNDFYFSEIKVIDSKSFLRQYVF